jgi:hypothetical protein
MSGMYWDVALVFLMAGPVALRCDVDQGAASCADYSAAETVMTLRLTAGRSRPIAHLLSRGFNFAASARGIVELEAPFANHFSPIIVTPCGCLRS